MDTLLIAVTALSLAIASAMSVVVLKVWREDRRRSDARIAALLEATSAPERAPQPRKPIDHRPVQSRRAAAPGVADLPLRSATPTAELFVEPARRASWGPLIALAAGAMAILLGLGLTLLGPTSGGGQISAAPASVRPGTAPLELLTLRHTAGPGSLTVTGLVQNPHGGSELRRAMAIVYALDATGEVLATSRAPIDLVTFGPGEESPFVVTVTVPGAVSRYRIGFRTDDGTVITHVDRRAGAEALAHK